MMTYDAKLFVLVVSTYVAAQPLRKFVFSRRR